MDCKEIFCNEKQKHFMEAIQHFIEVNFIFSKEMERHDLKEHNICQV